jgi:2-phospho-L-lactate/phosphoenolpyruvate guanylyltransferase
MREVPNSPGPRPGSGPGSESPAGGAWLGPAAVLVPVKAFGEAKLRLAGALSPARRAELARTMAERVVRSAGPLPVAVVCDDREVASWARALDALVIWEPGRGLNGAVQEGVDRLGSAGVDRVAIAAGDLPLATDLTWVTEFDGITIVPDRRHDGTNVIGVPTDAGFTFSYGPGSFARHLSEARRVRRPVRVVHDSPLAWDVDFPDDLEALTPRH